MATRVADPRRFCVESNGQLLAGESLGEGPPVVLLHGITASRRYVVHRSRVLPRRGYRAVAYDARGHGDSSPASPGCGYSYPEMVSDLAAVLGDQACAGAAVVAGHSMGAHTAVALALASSERVAGLVVLGPAYNGLPADEQALARWDALAGGLESDGVEGFLRVYERGALDPRWRDTVLRVTRERLRTHRHPGAVAAALRQVPRSRPFDDLDELQFLDIPALVVASHDDADPEHPYAVAQAYAERLPRGRLVSEQPGQSPLAWQGGKLSREIAAFCEQPAVRERLAGR